MLFRPVTKKLVTKLGYVPEVSSLLMLNQLVTIMNGVGGYPSALSKEEIIFVFENEINIQIYSGLLVLNSLS